jgi:hypothetical protein
MPLSRAQLERIRDMLNKSEIHESRTEPIVQLFSTWFPDGNTNWTFLSGVQTDTDVTQVPSEQLRGRLRNHTLNFTNNLLNGSDWRGVNGIIAPLDYMRIIWESYGGAMCSHDPTERCHADNLLTLNAVVSLVDQLETRVTGKLDDMIAANARERRAVVDAVGRARADTRDFRAAADSKFAAITAGLNDVHNGQSELGQRVDGAVGELHAIGSDLGARNTEHVALLQQYAAILSGFGIALTDLSNLSHEKLASLRSLADTSVVIREQTETMRHILSMGAHVPGDMERALRQWADDITRATHLLTSHANSTITVTSDAAQIIEQSRDVVGRMEELLRSNSGLQITLATNFENIEGSTRVMAALSSSLAKNLELREAQTEEQMRNEQTRNVIGGIAAGALALGAISKAAGTTQTLLSDETPRI